MSRFPVVCVVVPARNEAENVATLVDRIDTVLSKEQVEHVICVVDDGSDDGTWRVLTELHERHPGTLRATRLSRNFGKDASILAGLSSTIADCYIVMDCDGQHPPEMIPALLEKWRGGEYDIVSGVKVDPHGGPNIWTVAGRGFGLLFSALSRVDLVGASDYKLLSRRAVEAVLECGDYNFFFRATTEWIGFRQARLAFTVEGRLHGASKWSLGRLLTYAANGIVLYSYVPLYVLFLMGVVGVVLSAFLAGKLLLQYFFGVVPEGYSTLLAMSLISLSMMLTAVGILGLYMQNVLDQVKRRPRYLVMDELDVSPGRAKERRSETAARKDWSR